MHNYELNAIGDNLQLKVKNEPNGLAFNISEGAKIREILSIALSMYQMEVLPPYVDYSPWRIEFHEDNTLTVKHKNKKNNEINVPYDKLISLISAIESLEAKGLDKKRLQSRSISAQVFTTLPEGQLYED